jgi:hypothetical protein
LINPVPVLQLLPFCIWACSARSDQFNEEKKKLLQHIVQSFRLR